VRAQCGIVIRYELRPCFIPSWKLGDPITIRIIDYDWSASEVYTLTSRQGDPLAMRVLSGTIRPAKGGTTTLVFSSDFAIPTLSKPE